MIGGGQGAFIGAVHRIAARLDGQWELVAGALSSDPERARASGAELGLAPDRTYTSFTDLAQAEAARPDGVDAVAIVTPNHLHADPAIACLSAGLHVICDKPLAATPAQAEAIADAVTATGKQFILTHTYTGYPMIRQAREMVAKGALGDIRMVQVDYAQDWLAEDTQSKQAAWRTDPAQSGAGGAIGDIGTHAYHLAGFVTGLAAQVLRAELDSFVAGRRVDDNAIVTLRYQGGAKGALWASQIAVGHENTLTLRVYGTKASLIWTQETPNQLRFSRFGEPVQLLTRGGAGGTAGATRIVRVPPGHPEGYLEAFATLYSEAAHLIRHSDGGVPLPEGCMAPGVQDGLDGLRFIAGCLASSQQDGAWVSVT